MSSRNLRGLPRVLVPDRCTTVLAGSLRIGVSVPGLVPWASSWRCPIFGQRVFAFFAPASEEPPSENPLQTNFREFLFHALG